MEVSASHVNDPIGADSGVPGKQGLPPSPSKTISSANKWARVVKKSKIQAQLSQKMGCIFNRYLIFDFDLALMRTEKDFHLIKM